MKVKYKDVRKWLNSYKILKKTVRLKEKHLNDFIKEMYSSLKTSIAKTTRNIGSGSAAPALTLLFRMNSMYLEIIEDLSDDIETTKATMQEIFDAINKLNNYERSICFGRYIMGCSWNEIAASLGYEERQCQRYEENAIKKISEMKEFKLQN